MNKDLKPFRSLLIYITATYGFIDKVLNNTKELDIIKILKQTLMSSCSSYLTNYASDSSDNKLENDNKDKYSVHMSL